MDKNAFVNWCCERVSYREAALIWNYFAPHLKGKFDRITVLGDLNSIESLTNQDRIRVLADIERLLNVAEQAYETLVGGA